jgi:hypothetical protein
MHARVDSLLRRLHIRRKPKASPRVVTVSNVADMEFLDIPAPTVRARDDVPRFGTILEDGDEGDNEGSVSGSSMEIVSEAETVDEPELARPFTPTPDNGHRLTEATAYEPELEIVSEDGDQDSMQDSPPRPPPQNSLSQTRGVNCRVILDPTSAAPVTNAYSRRPSPPRRVLGSGASSRGYDASLDTISED